jgi:hypothetical protein
MKFALIPTFLLALVVGATPFFSAYDAEACSTIVREALSATEMICEGTERNEACYGHVSIEAQPQRGVDVSSFQFSAVGDRVDVARLKSLKLSPLDSVSGTWGVALLKLQADIPTAMANQNVDLLLFGDVSIQNAVEQPTLMDIQVGGIGNVNVRSTPASNGHVLQTLPSGSMVTARGRSRDGEWVYVQLADEKRGWLSRSLVRTDVDMESLVVANPRLDVYQPMQAFYLRTGPRTSSCEQASNDGILIQTPEGVAEVRLWINEVKIRLGSTAFIQAMPNNQMVIKTIEGKAHVEAMGIEQTVPAGTSVNISMNANLEPISAPSDPQPYLTQDVENLPVDALERQIEIAEPIVVTPEIVTAEPTATEYPTLEPSATDLPTNTPEPTATEYPTLEPIVTEYPTLEPSATGIPVPDASATPTATEALPDTFEPPTMTATSEAAAAAEVVTEGLGGGTPTETPMG